MRLTTLALLLLVAACSAHRTRVDCEGRLTSINAPAPALSGVPPAPRVPPSGARR